MPPLAKLNIELRSGINLLREYCPRDEALVSNWSGFKIGSSTFRFQGESRNYKFRFQTRFLSSNSFNHPNAPSPNLCDQSSVFQDCHGADSPAARWTLEHVGTLDDLPLLRLRSCHHKYLLATEEPFFMHVTGKKVIQSLPSRLDSSVEWEPVWDGAHLKLKTRYGNYLRANGGLPPWRNSITHDVPSRSHTQDWILWQIDVLDVYSPEEEKNEDLADPAPFSPDLLRSTPKESGDSAPLSDEGRIIHYNVVDDEGNANEDDSLTIHFKGDELEDLKAALEEEKGLKDITLCTKNPLNGKLYPCKLDLPPNHVKVHVFVVPPTSTVAGELVDPMTPGSISA